MPDIMILKQDNLEVGVYPDGQYRFLRVNYDHHGRPDIQFFRWNTRNFNARGILL